MYLVTGSQFLCQMLHTSGWLYPIDAPIAIIGRVLYHHDDIGVGWACRVDEYDIGGARTARNADGTEGAGHAAESLRELRFWIRLFQTLRILIIGGMSIPGAQCVTERSEEHTSELQSQSK